PLPLCPGTNARVDNAVSNIHHKTGRQDGYHDEQGYPLDHRIIALPDRPTKQVANAGIAKDDFGDKRAANKRTNSQCQTRYLGQHRVAEDITDDPVIADTQAS